MNAVTHGGDAVSTQSELTPGAVVSSDGGWRQLSRVTGLVGLVTVVLLFVPLFAGSGEEPTFKATQAEIVRYFQSIDSPLIDFARFVLTVGFVALLWFTISLSVLLSKIEGAPPWRSALAAGSGVVVVAVLLAGHPDAAAYRADDISPEVAQYAFDVGNVSFANAWVALGSFAICAGWVIGVTGFFRGWLGWWGVVSGAALAMFRAAWTAEIWLLPYLSFWLWVIVVSVLLIRRADRFLPATASRPPD